MKDTNLLLSCCSFSSLPRPTILGLFLDPESGSWSGWPHVFILQERTAFSWDSSFFSVSAQTSFKELFSGDGLECQLCLGKRFPLRSSQILTSGHAGLLLPEPQIFQEKPANQIFMKNPPLTICLHIYTNTVKTQPYISDLKSTQGPLMARIPASGNLCGNTSDALPESGIGSGLPRCDANSRQQRALLSWAA